MPKLLTARQAIAAKCKDCTYDQQAPGNWRQQVHACDIKSCALWMLRPRSSKPLTEAELTEHERVAGEPVTLHQQDAVRFGIKAQPQASLPRPIAAPKQALSGRSKRGGVPG
jgi:hypothetical protein